MYQLLGSHVIPRINIHDGRSFLDVALVIASQVFHLDHVAIVRACGGSVFMPDSKQFKFGEVVAWCRGGDVNSIVHYSHEGQDVTRKCLAQSLSYGFEEADNGKARWEEACFI